MNYVKPSKIQEHALPLLMRDPPENLIAQSQSGTGKTAAFSLAILHRIDPSNPATQAMVVAPTRELARQIVDVMKELGRFTSITFAEAVRQNEPVAITTIEAQVVVGTPGTMLNLLQRKKLNVTQLRMLALDEADNLLNLQSLGVQTMHLKRKVPESAQKIFFSATWEDNIVEFAKSFAGQNANQIRLERNELTVKSIKQFYVDCDSEQDRFEILAGLYGIMTISQSMIFVGRRDTAELIAKMMIDRNHAVTFLHAGLTPTDRDKLIDEFRNGRSKVLIATNVLSRGIDVANVNLVVNYDLPTQYGGKADCDTYLHRIGRTGRFGRLGVTINFIHNESSFEVLNTIQNHFGCDILCVPTHLDVADGTSAQDQSHGRLDRMEEFIKAAMKE
ncbi:RNA helicase required for poly(A+) mRNA export [Gryganskiella cystojenkinii]|nr:RNA helicase required for poly(A+) mRNA export [Gryganskiella cystojenkinii]